MIFVHSPKIEKEFINKNSVWIKLQSMYNDFILIADKSLAPLFEGKNLKQSLELIKSKKLTFISRGDKSGTDNKEKSLWKNLGTVPEKQIWY